jgi:hypothetical protein
MAALKKGKNRRETPKGNPGRPGPEEKVKAVIDKAADTR